MDDIILDVSVVQGQLGEATEELLVKVTSEEVTSPKQGGCPLLGVACGKRDLTTWISE